MFDPLDMAYLSEHQFGVTHSRSCPWTAQKWCDFLADHQLIPPSAYGNACSNTSTVDFMGCFKPAMLPMKPNFQA